MCLSRGPKHSSIYSKKVQSCYKDFETESFKLFLQYLFLGGDGVAVGEPSIHLGNGDAIVGVLNSRHESNFPFLFLLIISLQQLLCPCWGCLTLVDYSCNPRTPQHMVPVGV